MQESLKPKKRRVGLLARILRSGAEGDGTAEREGVPIYQIYDSEAKEFDSFFGEVLAQHGTIRNYVEAHYDSRKGDLVAAEFGGPARRLCAELNRDGMFKRTAGFVLFDQRDPEQRSEDAQRRHDVVEADVFFKDGAGGLSWRSVEEWVRDNGKPDIIIERMVQGIDLVRQADLFMAIVKRWLSQLAGHGTLLAEIPKKMPREEREKVVQAIRDLETSEAVFNPEMTSVLIRL